jgi:phage protein D
MKRAIYKVTVAGQDISSRIAPLLTKLRIADNQGNNSDSAEIEIDDSDAVIRFPRTGDEMEIALGWEDEDSPVAVFRGTIDEVKSKGGRGSGRELTISAKSLNTQSPATEQRQQNIDATDLDGAMQQAGRAAGVTRVRVDPELGRIRRDWWGMDNESFVGFGERMARENGGIFKIRGDEAILTKRLGGNASGNAIGTVRAVWGVNLISWDIAPILGRNRRGRVRARHYNRHAARWQERTTRTGTRAQAGRSRPETTETGRFSSQEEMDAFIAADAGGQESRAASGGGGCEIDGNPYARPGGMVEIEGARPGIDGTYRIKSVEHSYDSGGWKTKIEIEDPNGSAGSDTRTGAGASGTGGEGDLLPPVPPAPAPPTTPPAAAGAQPSMTPGQIQATLTPQQ